MSDLVGKTLGRYRVVGILGEGAMGRVYEAVLDGPSGFSKRVALKTLHPELAEDPAFVRSLVDEARIGSRLNHVNIVQILDFDTAEDCTFMAMEFVDGINLKALLGWAREQGTPLPITVALELAIQIGRGLHHAHEAKDADGKPLKLVYRDLKPSNVMVGFDGTAKLMDFGIAKAATRLSTTTRSGMIKGTPGYMSPEQLTTSKDLTLRSDIFSFGTVVFEIVTGRRLFGAPNLMALVRQVSFDDIRQRLEPAVDVLPDLLPLLERALQREPGDRYPSVGALLPDVVELRRAQPAGVEIAELMAAMRDGDDTGTEWAIEEIVGSLHSLDDEGEVRFPATLTVGRHAANDLTLDNPRISSWHAVVEWRDDRWQVRDLGSSNGTSVNKRRVRGSTSIKTDDVIRFAGVSRWRVGVLGVPADTEPLLPGTEMAASRPGAFDLDLHLAFDGPDEGTIRVEQEGQSWSVRTGQRFILLHLLGSAGGSWVHDDDLKLGLWGRSGALEVDPSALYKLIHDTRKMLSDNGVDGKLVQKSQGRTRLCLARERIHLE